MLITIRIVIDVPENNQDKYPDAIEKILESVKEQFPELQVNKRHAPVTVTIKRFEAVKHG